MPLHRSWFMVAIGVCAVATGPSALAEPVISEIEILAALDQNPTVQAVLSAPLAEAQAAQSAAGQLASPTLRTEREDAEGVEWTWSVGWQPPLPGERRRLRAQAEAVTHATEQSTALKRLELRLELRQAYAIWSFAHAHQTALQTYTTTLGRLADQTAARAEAGEVAGIAARRLRLAAQRARTAAELQAARAFSARGKVEALAGQLPQQTVPSLPDLPPFPNLGSDLSDHPEQQAAEFELERRALALELARRTFHAPALEWGWKEIKLDSESSGGPIFGLSWSLPLRSQRRAAIVQATAKHSGARTTLEQGNWERRAALEAHRSAFERLRAAVANAPTDDSDLRQAVILSYQLGETDLTDLLDTLAALRDTTLEHLNSLAIALESHRALERAVGKPLELQP